MRDTSQAAFGGARKAERPKLDLGKPRYLLRETDSSGRTTETWIYCPVCLARKVSGDEGSRYTGGYVHLLGKPLTDRDGKPQVRPDGKAIRRARAVIPCSCALGLALRKRWAKRRRVADDRLPIATSFDEEDLALPNAVYAARNPRDASTEIVGPLGEPDPKHSGAADAEEELPL